MSLIEQTGPKEFAFTVGQKVRVISKVRQMNGKLVTVISRHGDGGTPWYKVGGEGIHQSVSYFEDQLEATS
jgi:hypothetical protein